MSDSVDIPNTSPSTIETDWAEHPLRNSTAESYGKSFAIANASGFCALIASILTPVLSYYNDMVNSLFSFFSNHFTDIASPITSALDDFESATSDLVSSNSVFDMISYALSLDGLVNFFTGVYFDSFVLFSLFIGAFTLIFISFCFAILGYRLILRLIKICSLGYIHTT